MKERGNRQEMAARAERRVDWGKNTSSSCDWEKVDPLRLVDCLATVARAGGALRFGYTRDFGVFAIGVYGDGSPYTLYIRPNEDIYHALKAISNAFASRPDSLDDSRPAIQKLRVGASPTQ